MWLLSVGSQAGTLGSAPHGCSPPHVVLSYSRIVLQDRGGDRFEKNKPNGQALIKPLFASCSGVLLAKANHMNENEFFLKA